MRRLVFPPPPEPAATTTADPAAGVSAARTLPEARGLTSVRPSREVRTFPDARPSREAGLSRKAQLSREARPSPTPKPPRRTWPSPADRTDSTLWLRGLMAGVQAAVLSALCVIVPGVAAFTETSAAAVNNGVSWLDAARSAADIWLLGHGGSWLAASDAGTGLVTVAPIGIALLGVLTCRFLARASSATGWWLAGFGVLGYVLVAALVMFGVTTPAARASAPMGLIGAFGVAVAGFWWARRPSARPKPRRGRRPIRPPIEPLLPAWAAWSRANLPLWLRIVPQVTLRTATLIVAGAALLTAIWLGAGWAGFADASTALAAGFVGGVVLMLLNAAFLPNLVFYGVAYLAGAGFSVGIGTLFSPAETIPGPIPALPLLAALPQAPPPAAVWLVLIPIAAGAAAGWQVRRLIDPSPWWTMALSSALSTAAAAAGLAGLVAAASGAAGPGRMAQVGAPPRLIFLLLCVECVIPAVLVAVLARTNVATRIYTAIRPQRPIRVRGRGPTDPPAGDPAPDPLPTPPE